MKIEITVGHGSESTPFAAIRSLLNCRIDQFSEEVQGYFVNAWDADESDLRKTVSEFMTSIPDYERGVLIRDLAEVVFDEIGEENEN